MKFLHQWMAEHLPNVITDDPAAISDLVNEMMEAASRAGISADEINEEVDSVFDLISEAMQHRGSGLVEADQAGLKVLAGRLAREAGITETEARDLIERVGTDWASLLREAHFLREQH
ncbi:DUF768 domain-containing protein [Mesorhizobium sp. WSM3224]|uniref:DUF768 domain-containing protein n=1 Tax=Mesorhizobium sp. WSM3224 TaxID=1040986 RepID=UPI0003F7056F|nr:DUF768 domain-containing protein [Mesorhizobium sp. WSM3224]